MVFHSLLPRSRTYMVLNEIEKGGSFVTTSLNAASMALIDSGYSLNYCIGACGIILDGRDGQMYTEKQYQEKFANLLRTYEPQQWQSHYSFNHSFALPNQGESAIKATFCTVIKNTNTQNPVSLIAEGKFSLNQLLQAQRLSVEPVESFFDYLKNFTKNRFV